jgi:hypothetical protein
LNQRRKSGDVPTSLSIWYTSFFLAIVSLYVIELVLYYIRYRPPRPGVETTRITDTLMSCFRLTHDSRNDSDFLTLESDMYLVNDEAGYRILSCSDRSIRDSTLYDGRSICQGLHTVQGLLTTSPRPSPTCPYPSKRGTGMTRASATRGDGPITDVHPCSAIASPESTHRVDDPTKH